jgi:hypothetical protein
MPGQQIRSAPVFQMAAGQTTLPVFAPADTEITVTIAAVNGIVQGAATVDYTNSGDARVAAGTATWIGAALVYTTAGVFTQKVYADCWVRVNCTGGNVYVKVDPSGETINPTNNPFQPYLNSSVAPPPAPPFVITGTPGLAVDNSPGWAAQVAEGGSLVSQTVTARLAAPGDYLFNALNDVFPSLSPVMFGRGAIRLVPGPNLPAVTGAPGPGAEAAFWRVLARTPPNPDIQAYETDIGGFNMDATGVAQANVIHGLRFPAPNPAKNSFDPDPAFTTNKDYVAAFLHDIDIVGFSGDGCLVGTGRGRLHCFSARFLNNNVHGLEALNNDIVMSGHWAAGGNGNTTTGGFGIKLGNAAGFYAWGGNLWSNPNAQSPTSGAIWFNQRRYAVLGGTEHNAWARIDGGPNYDAPIMMIGNMYHQHAVNFTGDGVMRDISGTNDPRVQSNVGIQENQALAMWANNNARTDATSFATKGNFGGDTTGAFGTAPTALYDISTNGSNNAMVNILEPVCSAPNVKPWTSLPQTVTISNATPGVVHLVAHGYQNNYRIGLYTTDTLPAPLIPTTQVYYVQVIDADNFSLSLVPGPNNAAINTTTSGTGTHTLYNLSTLPFRSGHGNQVNFAYQDAYVCLFRTGALGPVPHHLALGIAGVDDYNLTYDGEIGDRTIVGGNDRRYAAYGAWEYYNAIRFADVAYDAHQTADAGSRTIGAAQAYQFLLTAGGGIGSFTINIPTDQVASYELPIVLIGGPIASLTLAIAGGGTFVNNGLSAFGTGPMIVQSPGFMAFRVIYRRDTNKVEVVGITAGDNGGLLTRTDGTNNQAGVVGHIEQQTVLSASAVALTTNTPVNVLSLPLPPGRYMVWGMVGFTGTAPAIGSLQAGISALTGTLPAVKDNGYGTIQYSGVTTGFTGIFQTMALGPTIVNQALGGVRTMYLVAEATFSSGSISAYGQLMAVAI